MWTLDIDDVSDNKKHLHISQTIDQSLTLLTMKAWPTPDISTRNQMDNNVTAY